MLSRSPRPRLVLMTADPIGGVWTYAIDLAHGLARSGVRTLLATMGRSLTQSQRAEAQAVPGLILETSDYRVEWMSESADDVRRAGDWLLEVQERHRPDLAHINGFAHAALPWPIPRIAVAHSCIPSWWQAVHGEPAPASYQSHAETARAGLHAADLVVAPTRAFLAALQDLYGPLPRARAVHNGRDVKAFAPGDKREVIFSAGRVWDLAKNVRALDDVAAGLPWPVVVAGDWRPPDGHATPPANLLCLDLVEPARVGEWMAEAAIFALPAAYEPFGLAPLEAGLSGCALVLGDIPTLREVWGDAAVFVPPHDRDALRAALVDLIRSPERRARLARAARRRALRYSVGRMARGYLNLYSEALAVGGAPGGTAPDPSMSAPAAV